MEIIGPIMAYGFVIFIAILAIILLFAVVKGVLEALDETYPVISFLIRVLSVIFLLGVLFCLLADWW